MSHCLCQIHDLHAKYQAAVNKAENVAQSALRAASEALKEQSNKEGNSGGSNLVGLESFNRFKRSLSEEARFAM